LISVFATHVNQSENRKIDRFITLHRCVYVQKLSRAFAMTVWMSYINCSVCAKTLLSFCVYKQRLCCIFAMYIFATHVNRSENRKIDRFTALHRCVYAQKLSHVFAMTVWMSYISCSMCAKTLLLFCIYKQRLCRVFAMYVIATHVNWSENRNRSIYCVVQMCMCAKAESCLRNVYVCDIYELQCMRKDVAVVLCIWVKTVSCLCSVCDCDACKLIRKSKSINLLRCTDVYMRKSWIMSLQYVCVWRIWVAAHAQKRCCHSVYMSKDCVMFLQCMWLRCM